MGRFRIYFVSDLHGSEVCFRKFLNSVPIYRPDLLIYGGDIMGKVLQPIFQERPDAFRWFPTGDRAETFRGSELPRVERAIADRGRYSLVTTPAEWDRLRADPDGLELRCRELGKDRARSWLRLFEERLGGKGPPLIVNVGNDDTDGLLDLLRNEAPPGVIVPEGRVVSAGPYEFFGCGYANMTPWHCPRDLPEADLAKVLDRTAGQIGQPRRTIFDIHAPPTGTSLDMAPQLDENLRPRTASGQTLSEHVGSTSVRQLIESVRPVASLHGHIHESMGADFVAGVPVFNPGSTYFSGTLQGLLLDLDGEHVLDHLFVTG
ncbi:MAG: metallophosphoesterase family protein [Thermoplasmata archaeon]